MLYGVLIPLILPEVTVVMFLCNTGQSCHLQHAAVARNCYELQSMLWPTLDCCFEHDNQTPCNNHCEPEKKKNDSINNHDNVYYYFYFLNGAFVLSIIQSGGKEGGDH